MNYPNISTLQLTALIGRLKLILSQDNWINDVSDYFEDLEYIDIGAEDQKVLVDMFYSTLTSGQNLRIN